MAVLLVVNYNKGSMDRYMIRAVRAQAISTRESLLRDLAMTGMCQLVRSIISNEGQVWMEGEQHPVFPGKRIDVDILFDEEVEHCNAYQEQSEEEQQLEFDQVIQEPDSSNSSMSSRPPTERDNTAERTGSSWCTTR